MSFINWVIDSLASEDVIDLYFVLSDLVDIDVSEAEIAESGCFDALANSTARDGKFDRSIPIGRQVY